MADNTDTTQALKQASDAVAGCMDQCRAVSAQHSGVTNLHDDLRSLHGQIPDSNLRAQLAAKMGAVATTHKAVADGHDQLTRGLEAAQLAVRGAADAAGADGYVEPTHGPQGGSQVDQSHSDGAPRDFSPAGIRERDQRRGCEAGYLAKLRAMQGR
jgi:hypothetical protein